ncbi:uncharacterized protein [Spinacia oleracea]|uniref:Reverse transcriptase domain-containing protein n=1 Tax=Spinacia oleracea TaxID=3562 RepID=A0ABM3R165_SPIOL|nr:uncharacterized protein LOC130464025 [Spinacia oleracea]
MVDATAGHEMLTFMDAFSGYNQILMHLDDQEKTAFITERGTYCYKVIPFGLRNAGATNQRLVNRMFKRQLGNTMEVYIDDMLVKSKKASDHIRKNEKFIWTEQHEAALQQLKQYLSEPPLLSKPMEKKELQLYLAVTESTISDVLVREEDDKQLPIYYVSKSLLSAKMRMSKWAIQLGCFDIRYEPHTTIKSQALTDFVADFNPSIQHEVDREVNILSDTGTSLTWTIYTDGSSNTRGTVLGIVLKSPQWGIFLWDCVAHADHDLSLVFGGEVARRRDMLKFSV